MEFLHLAKWQDHDIDFARWLHPVMWHVALESWHWIRHVAAPCNVACGSGIMTVNSPSGSTLQCDTWLWDDVIEFARWQHPAMWHVALESWQWIHEEFWIHSPVTFLHFSGTKWPVAANILSKLCYFIRCTVRQLCCQRTTLFSKKNMWPRFQ